MDIRDLPKVSFDERATSKEIIKALERVRIAKEKLGNCQLKIMMDRFYDKANRLISDDMAKQYQQAEARHFDDSDIDPHSPPSASHLPSHVCRLTSATKRPKSTAIDNRN